MEKEELLEKIKEIAPQGKISCSDAHKLAEKMGIHPIEVGKVCNDANIKILGCELGCF